MCAAFTRWSAPSAPPGWRRRRAPGSPARSGTIRPPTRSRFRRRVGRTFPPSSSGPARQVCSPPSRWRGTAPPPSCSSAAGRWRSGPGMSPGSGATGPLTPRATPSSGRGGGNVFGRETHHPDRRSPRGPRGGDVCGVFGDSGARQGREAARGDRPAPALLPADARGTRLPGRHGPVRRPGRGVVGVGGEVRGVRLAGGRRYDPRSS